MYGTSIALLMVVRSGQAGGIKGAEASLTDETLATMSPFALVRRGFGWWSCGDSNPGPSHCEGVPDPIGHRSMRCMSCALTATVPRCRPRGAPGGHANRSLAGEPAHRRGSTFEPCVPLKAAFRPRRAVSDRHVHDLRRRPTSRCPLDPLVQPVPTRPHRYRQMSHRLARGRRRDAIGPCSCHTARAAEAAPRHLTGVATAVLRRSKCTGSACPRSTLAADVPPIAQKGRPAGRGVQHGRSFPDN